jgi:hypothetical protein
MSAINLSSPAQRAARVRLVYKITTGVAGGLERARAEADSITDAWTGSGTAFVVRAASDPVQGGAPGSGALSALAHLWGLNEWGTAIEVKTHVDLPTMSWQQFVSPLRSLGFTDLYASAEFVSAELLVAGQPASSTPAAQAQAAQDAADQSRQQDDFAGFLDALQGALPWVLLIAGAAIAFVVWRKTRSS